MSNALHTWLALLMLFLFAPAILARAVEPPSGYVTVVGDGWTWASAGGHRPPNDGERAYLTKTLARLRERLGVDSRHAPLVVFSSDRRAFERAVRHWSHDTPDQWVVALAFPGLGVLVLDGSRFGVSHPGEFPETATHELVHIVIGEASPAVPRWYHEGLALSLSGAEITAVSRQHVAMLATNRQLLSFSDLAGVFPESHRQTSTAYTQSQLFVEFLSQHLGDDIHARILSATREERTFAAAFTRATGVTLDAAEQRWLNELTGGFSWWSWYVHNVELFSTLAVLVVVGFLIQRSARRKRLRRMAEEESALDAAERAAGGVP